MNVRAAFDLARAGNFPSVASNVLAALVLSSSAAKTLAVSATATKNWITFGINLDTFPPAGLLALTVLAGCLIYAGGATLNDVFDAAFDRARRPERAIPRGLISRSGAAWLGGAEMSLGLALLIFALGASPIFGVALAACILAYDWLHKRWIGSVVLMAGCRVLLALTVATILNCGFTSALLWWVGALFVYIVTLSLIARWEYAPGAPAAKIGRSVGRLLAFIPLIDAIALALVGAWLPALACAAAIPLGRWAQRLAAST
ncbi:MAG: UbiA family prenyltransferase [Opitutaceae bacterium]|nr:UbiA family prenyltransferase [Opitutaceae bacterium]